jgi:hypothetical protein
MLENTLQAQQPAYPNETEHAQSKPARAARTGSRAPLGLLLCGLGFVVCILLTVTPLIRMPDPIHLHYFAPGFFLARASGWFPLNLGTLTSPQSTYTEFFLLIILAFLCYALGARLVRRQEEGNSQGTLRGWIWLSTVLAGAVYVVTPAMLSHDILVYASYSRVLAAYHSNPYFVPISTFPQDVFTPLNYWAGVVSAYGPLWTLVCGFFGWLLNPDPAAYIVVFRIFALGAHLLNTWLVGRALHAMGRPPRTVTLGMLLYAWNPLLLLESSLGGHNDVFMVTFVLVGILLTARAEARGEFLRARGYLPPVGALTLAALVKFTALPVLAVALLFLVCEALRPTAASPREFKQAPRNWRGALLPLAWSGLTAALVALAFYAPFWLGHNLGDIIASFKNPPSSLYAENSFMRSIVEWGLRHPALRQNTLLSFLSNRHLWDDLTFAAIALCLLVGATRLWTKPATRTFLAVSLATLCAVLLITPWFFSWYVTWILALAVVWLPRHPGRFEAALLALTFTFGFSALLTYLFNGGLFGSYYYLVSLFTTLPPVCAFLLTLVMWRPVRSSITGDAKR